VGVGVDNERHKDKPAPGRTIGEICHPTLVWPLRMECPLDEIHGPGIVVRGDSRALYRSPTRDAPKPHGSHKPFRGAAGDLESLSMQLTPDLPRAVYFMILFPDTSYVAFVEFVLLTARRELFRSILKAF